MSHFRLISLLSLIVVSSVRCHRPAVGTEPPSTLCPTSDGEWRLASCAVLTGTVRDGSGRGLPGVSIRVAGGTNLATVLDVFEVTEASGSFKHTVVFRAPADYPLPGPMPVRVHATAYKGYAQPTPSTFYADSTLATLQLVAAGQPWIASDITLTIRFP